MTLVDSGFGMRIRLDRREPFLDGFKQMGGSHS
jgi:hypothetical protein